MAPSDSGTPEEAINKIVMSLKGPSGCGLRPKEIVDAAYSVIVKSLSQLATRSARFEALSIFLLNEGTRVRPGLAIFAALEQRIVEELPHEQELWDLRKSHILDVIEEFTTYLARTRYYWLRFRIGNDLEGFDVAAKKAHLIKWLEDEANLQGLGNRCYSSVLKEFLDQTDREIEIEKKRVKIVKEIVGADETQEDKPGQFTRKEVIYLLQEIIPLFKDADNTRKAEFITKLTGYTSTKGIADEFSNIRSFANPKLLAEWTGNLKRSGRGRKKVKK